MKTENYKSLNLITNCFLAVEQIRNVRKQPLREGEDRSVKSDNTDNLEQIISIIARYSPDMYKTPLTETLSKINLYNNSYRSLKRNLGTMRDQGFNKEQFINILSIMHPVLNTRNQHIIDKILKFNELLNS